MDTFRTRPMYAFLFFVTVPYLIDTHSPMFFSGSIRFPQVLTNVPEVRVYWSGHKIACETDRASKVLYFSIPGVREQRMLYVVITPRVDYLCVNNTPQFQYIHPSTPYKFYVLQLTQCQDEATKKTTFLWVPQQMNLGKNQQGFICIPDDTIIIKYDPHLVAGLEGGNAINLPTIIIKPDVIALLGSEEKVHDHAIQLVLSALDVDAINTTLCQETKQGDQRTIMSMITA